MNSAQCHPASEGKEIDELVKSGISSVMDPERVCPHWGAAERTIVQLLIFITDYPHNVACEVSESNEWKAILIHMDDTSRQQ
jgi:hypothetical protein